MEDISVKQLLDYIDGNLSKTEFQKIEKHLKEHPYDNDVINGIKTVYENEGVDREEIEEYLENLEFSFHSKSSDESNLTIISVPQRAFKRIREEFNVRKLAAMAAGVAIILACMVGIPLNEKIPEATLIIIEDSISDFHGVYDIDELQAHEFSTAFALTSNNTSNYNGFKMTASFKGHQFYDAVCIKNEDFLAKYLDTGDVNISPPLIVRCDNVIVCTDPNELAQIFLNLKPKL